MLDSGCEVAALEFRCGHIEMWPTELCDDHKMNRNWHQCRRIVVIPWQLFQHICIKKCGGKSVLELEFEPQVDDESNKEDKPKAEAECEANDKKEYAGPLSEDIPFKLSPLDPSWLLKLKKSNNDSDGNVLGMELEGSSDLSKIGTPDIPKLSIGESIDDSDDDVSEMDVEEPSGALHHSLCDSCARGTG
jgi:hypothetical protein